MADSFESLAAEDGQKSDERVTEIIREMISSGQLNHAGKLTETILARQLGLSRTPVRVALKVLAAEGVLAKLSGRGYEIRSFSGKDKKDALQVRAILEALAAEQLASIGLDPQNRSRLEKSLATTEAVVRRAIIDNEALEAFSVANMIFHRTITKATANHFISDCLGRLAVLPSAGLGALHSLDGGYPSLKRLTVSHHQHMIIFQAIEKGEGGRAYMMMREHIEHAAEYHNLFGAEQEGASPNH